MAKYNHNPTIETLTKIAKALACQSDLSTKALATVENEGVGEILAFPPSSTANKAKER